MNPSVNICKFLSCFCCVCLEKCERTVKINESRVYLMFQECVSVQLPNPTDSFGLCENCVHSLKALHDFKQNATANFKLMIAKLWEADAVKNPLNIEEICHDFMRVKKYVHVKAETVKETEIRNGHKTKQDTILETNDNNDVKFELSEISDVLPNAAKLKVHSCIKKRRFSKSKAVKHNKKFTQNQPLNCSLCSYVLNNLTDLVKHVRTRHKIKAELACDQCDSNFFLQPQLDRHKDEKHGDNPLEESCPTCGKHVRHLQKHQRLHLNNYECFECNEKCRTQLKLQKHMLLVHTGRYSSRKLCYICGKHYNNPYHPLTHQQDKPFECEACKKSFATAFLLRQHNKAVHGQLVSCHICSKMLKRKNVSVHIKEVHAEVRSYVCEHCQKAFKGAAILKRHQRQHTDERPYLCSFCNKRFRARTTMRIHQRIHTGEKPYACNVCGRAFTQRFAMQTHARTHFKVAKTSSGELIGKAVEMLVTSVDTG